jgi:two-component system, sensor histidine kinase and response regulator
MEKPNILIVEDSKTFADYLSEVISKENYKATAAYTGKQGLDLLKDGNFNLMLLDMELPDCSGIDIIKCIRKNYNQTELPVIFISATTDEHKIIESLKYGANDFISKPFSEITLKIKIRNLLQLQLSGMHLADNLKIQEEQNLQLQKYANELSQINKEKDLFVSILVHDLKNPFHAILGFSDLLLINLNRYDKEKIEKHLKLINEVANQTYHLLEDLILWSKSQAGRIPFQPQKVVLSDICNEIVGILNYQSLAKQIKISILNVEHINIMADVNMLKTILRNLVSNAIKFTNQNGEIKISAEKDKTHTIIIVSDNGVGIDEKTQSKLFISQQTYSTKGTASEKGTGLGLLLCMNFVENHGGKIWVESEVGKGSDFKFTMPLCVD